MIQLNVVKGSPKSKRKVVLVIGCVLECEVLICASHVMLRLFRMLPVCSIWEGKMIEV